MKKLFPFAVLILSLISSCGLHIQKRLYRDGFYINTSQNKNRPETRMVEEQMSLNTVCAEAPHEADDTVVKNIFSSIQREGIAVPDSLPKMESDRNTNNAPAKDQVDPAPNEHSSESEIARIEKLNKDGTAFMKAALIVFPLAFLLLMVALTLSLIALAKIRRLERAGTISPEEETNIAKQKKRARKTAWISGIVLVILIAGIVIFFSTVQLTFGGNIPMVL